MSKKNLLIKKVNITKFDYSKTYEWAHSECYNFFEHLLIRKILNKNSPKGKFAVDIGCGPGLVLKEMCNVYNHCIGVDISREILKCARNSLKVKDKPNIDLLCADIEYMPFKSGTFDIATMYSVLHHLPNLNGSLKEVNRMMNSKSTLILFHEPNENHLRRVSEKTLIRVLEKIRRILYRTIYKREWQRSKQEGLYRSAKLGELEKLADIHSPKGFSVVEIKTLLELNGFQVTNVKTRIQSFMATFSRLYWPYKLIGATDFLLSEAPILSKYLPLLLCIAKKKEG